MPTALALLVLIPPGLAHADDPPTLTVEATCDGGLVVTTAGWPDGTFGTVGINAEPPMLAPFNSTETFGWRPRQQALNDGVSSWSIDISIGPDQAGQQTNAGQLACDGPFDPTALDPATDLPSVSVVVASAPLAAVFVEFEWCLLAPPW